MSKKAIPRIYDKAGKPVKVADKSWYTLQASGEAEAEMERIVREHLKFASSVADLFSGCGTFALRLAAEALLHESHDAALAAEDRAIAEAALTRLFTYCETIDV